MLLSNNQPSIEGGETFYTIGDGAACLAHSDGTKSFNDKIAVAKTAQDISSANIAGLPDSLYQYASLIAGCFERQHQSNTLTIVVMCCSLVFVLLYSEFIELTTINCYKTVSIRVSQIEPDP